MSGPPSRREVVASLSALSAAGVAGCLGRGDAAVPPPQIDHDDFDHLWRLTDESGGLAFEERIWPLTLRAFEHSTIYEHVPMSDALSDTFESIDGTPVTVFFSRLDLRPGVDRLPFGIAHDRVMAEVRAGVEAVFRDELLAAGIVDLRQDGRDSLSVAAGHTATVFRFTARFPLEDDVVLDDGSIESMRGDLALLAMLAIWHDGSDVLVAGGVSPAEPVVAAIEASLPPDVNVTEDLEIDEAFRADPETFMEQIEALIVVTE